MPEEVREWITVNGKHIPLDKDGEPITETGKKTLGKETGKSGAQSRTKQQQGTTAKPETAQQTGDVVTKSDGLTYSKTLAQYREEFKNEPKGEIKAAHKFFREQLQGKSVICETREGPQRVFFTFRSWQKLRFKLDKDPLKAELFPLIPDILTTGEYTPRSLHKERKDDIVFFHQYRKVMHTSKGDLDIFVDVTEHVRKNAKLNAYNLTRQGTSNYKKRVKEISKQNALSERSGGAPKGLPKELKASNDSVVKDIVPHILEVASIRFADEEKKEVIDEEVREWITVNGKHIPLDKDGEPITETGKKTLGKETGDNIKESGGIKYSKTLAEYKKDFKGLKKQNSKAAEKFYKNELQRKSVQCETNKGLQTVYFTDGAWRELKKYMDIDPVKGECVPHIPEILTTGKYRPSQLYKERKDDIVMFHEYRKVVRTTVGDIEVIVDVAERKEETPQFHAYNLTRQGSPNYQKRAEFNQKRNASKAEPGQLLEEFEAPNDSVVTDIVPHILEVASIRFADEEEKEVIDDMARDKPRADRVAFDAKNTQRRKDSNGYLHVDASNITKEQVAPYYGSEIPNWQKLGLEPGRLYYMYRPAEELKKAAAAFNGMPVLFEHHATNAENPAKEYVIGSLGTDAEFRAPYIVSSLIITDGEAIAAIERGDYKELSAAYMYTPVMQGGIFNGERYDGRK